jgi:L-iditol 2-dehydrogenase
VGAQQAGPRDDRSGEVPVNDLITVRLPVERVHDAIDTVAKGAAIKVTIEP